MALRLLLAALLALVLAGCQQTSLKDFDADRNPSVWVGSINGNDGRRPPGGVLYAPAGNLVDPVTSVQYAYPVVVEVTAADERAIESVELRIDGSTFDTLTPTENPGEFKNPFTFVVPFSGTASGLVPTRVSVVATDSAGQTSDPHEQTVQVDGSLPILDFTPPAGDQSGQIILTGEASDPESGILFFDAQLNFSESLITLLTDRSFVAVLDTTTLTDGEQLVTLIATNGANVTWSRTWTFTVKNETDTPAP